MIVLGEMSVRGVDRLIFFALFWGLLGLPNAGIIRNRYIGWGDAHLANDARLERQLSL